MSFLDEVPVDCRLVRFMFDAGVDMTEVEGTLRLSLIACDSLHGQNRVELEAFSSVDRVRRSVAIQTRTDVGCNLAVVFLGYARREFGAAAVSIVHGPHSPSEGGI